MINKSIIPLNDDENPVNKLKIGQIAGKQTYLTRNRDAVRFSCFVIL